MVLLMALVLVEQLGPHGTFLDDKHVTKGAYTIAARRVAFRLATKRPLVERKMQ